MRLYADTNRLALDSWNVGHGNKILHLYFLINYADKINAIPYVGGDSSLDSIFELRSLKTDANIEVPCLYKEKSCYPNVKWYEKILFKLNLHFLSNYNLENVIRASKTQYDDELNLFDKNISFKEGYISGHFWHYNLMPTLDVLNKYIKVKESLRKTVLTKYSDLLSSDGKSCAVHFRETDFKNHLKHIHRKSIVLPLDYYVQSTEIIEDKLGSNITYHLFSDNPEKLKKIFKGRKVIIHNDNAQLDWACLHMSRSIIQSNSSFCWTASLHNKIISIQPKGGFNWDKCVLGSVPYNFEMSFSENIDLTNC